MSSYLSSRLLVVAAVGLLPLGCASVETTDVEPDDEVVAPEATGADEALRICEVPAPPGVISAIPDARGVVLAHLPAGTDGSTVLVEHATGRGCDLALDQALPVATSGLSDVDLEGNLYVYPSSEEHVAGAVSTWMPDAIPSGMIVKVDRARNVTEIVEAGRGIWSFGIAPEGGTLWVTACGPTGIFAITPDGLEEAMVAPPTLWQQFPAVLADATTFWSVGVRNCGYGAPDDPSCAYALVRSTPEGSHDVGTTLVDFGAGYEQASLARCGGRACGIFESGVVVWNEEGAVAERLTLTDLGARPGEQITGLSGTADGLYVVLRAETASRVVFASRTEG